MLRKKSPLGDLGGILFFPYSASGLPGLFIWKVLALASILKAPNYSVIISNFIKIFFLKIVASPILGQERGREYARSIYFIYSFYHGKCSSLLYLQMAGWR